MAEVQSNFQIETKVNHYRMVSALLWVPTITYIVAFLYGFRFNGILHIVPFIPGIIGVYYWRTASKLKKSMLMESGTVDLKDSIPDGYDVIENVELTSPNGKERTEINHLVVGKNGVFVVDVKNVMGTIEGNESSSSWVQHKDGRKGGNYSTELRNPMKEVRKQVHLLSNLFKKNKLDVLVEGSVLFTNKRVDVKVKSSGKTPIFTDGKDLTEHIEKRVPKKELDEAQLEEVRSLLNSN
ncbi:MULTISPECIES: nuclease-related domain-containing protein [Bacillaceae]|uniref:NERD domain-containing protein n=1 Tax=Evansella alkalicola TaxID=745819 RepID=A0ABS6JWU9_9BACI|nr:MULTISPECIES: nuclease-related domain-containing protein [Bacillaceae]MBU9721590.1 NERD domain-containing protein [Bacillus alkalicola]